MKKIVALGMAVMMSVGLFVFAYADTSSPVAVKAVAATKAFKHETKEISGTVKEVRAFDFLLKAEDGKEYTIPVGMILESEAYKKMNLKAGDKVTVEGFDPGDMKNMAFSVALKPDEKTTANTETKIITAEKSDVIVAKGTIVKSITIQNGEAGADNLFLPEKITANGQTIDMVKLGENLGGNIQFFTTGAFKHETKEISGTVKEIKEYDFLLEAEDGKIYTVPTGMLSASKEYKAMNLKAGDRAVVEGFAPADTESAVIGTATEAGTTEAFHLKDKILPAEKITAGERQPIIIHRIDAKDGSGNLFLAEKITANGQTVDLTKIAEGANSGAQIRYIKTINDK